MRNRDECIVYGVLWWCVLSGWWIFRFRFWVRLLCTASGAVSRINIACVRLIFVCHLKAINHFSQTNSLTHTNIYMYTTTQTSAHHIQSFATRTHSLSLYLFFCPCCQHTQIFTNTRQTYNTHISIPIFSCVCVCVLLFVLCCGPCRVLAVFTDA